MPTPLERLREAGIKLPVDPDDQDVRTACTGLAGSFLRRDCKIVGLMPAADNVAVPAVAVQLGRSLVALTGSTVAIIDAAGTWPALQDEADHAPGASIFATTWIEDNLAVMAPRTFDVGGMLMNIAAALADESAIFAAMLVDMTGFSRIGEHLAAMSMVDGVVLVARAARTTEKQLARWMREIPAKRNLGVLLLGA